MKQPCHHTLLIPLWVLCVSVAKLNGFGCFHPKWMRTLGSCLKAINLLGSHILSFWIYPRQIIPKKKRKENRSEKQKELEVWSYERKKYRPCQRFDDETFYFACVCLNEIVTHAKTTLALIAHSKHNYPNIYGNPQMEPSVYIKAKNKTIRNEITSG